MTQSFAFAGLDDKAWMDMVGRLATGIHPVDRDATQIWFLFYPLRLTQLMAEASDPKLAADDMLLRGQWRLEDQIDSSHWFCYGHRYWPQVKEAVLASTSEGGPEAVVRAAAQDAAARAKVDVSLVLGMAAIGFRTLQQVGAEAFRRGSGEMRKRSNRSPESVLNARRQQGGGGLMGLFNRLKKNYTVVWDEDQGRGFRAFTNQIMTAASMREGGDYSSLDDRCLPGEGPIPIECRSGKCSKCWIGILGGQEHLAPMTEWERKRMRLFGYLGEENTEERPCVRLACQTQIYGNVQIVIPPWNAFIGKLKRIRLDKEYSAEELRQH